MKRIDSPLIYKAELKALISILLTFALLQTWAQTPKLILPIGHTGWVGGARFSPDGKSVLTVSADNTAKIWDVQTGRLLYDFDAGPDDKAAAMGIKNGFFSPDGSSIITLAADDETPKLWSAQRGVLLFSLRGHKREVLDASFSPDGKTIATASEDETIKIWDTQSGKLLRTLKGHKSYVRSVCYSPDGRNLVSACQDSTVQIWDVQKGKVLHTLIGHTDRFIMSARYSPDGKKIVTTSFDKTARVWDAETGKFLLSLVGNKKSLIDASFSPDSKTIATASDDKIPKIWDAQSGNLLFNLEGHSGGHMTNSDYPESTATFSPDGKKIVTTVSADQTAKIWDAQSGKLLHNLQGHTEGILSANFSPDGSSLVTACGDQTAKLWDVESGSLLKSFEGHTENVYTANFSPDGSRIVTSSADKTPKIWEVNSGRILRRLKGHSETVSSARYSSDGSRIMTVSWDKSVKTWDAETGRPLTSFTGKDGSFITARMSPDNETIVTTSFEEDAKLWNARTGKLLQDLNGHKGLMNAADFNRDGKRVLTLTQDGDIKLWETETGKEVQTFAGSAADITPSNFSPDGKSFVVDGTLWDVASGKVLSHLKLGDTYNIGLSGFSPDGKSIMTAFGPNSGVIVIGGTPYTVRIWDVESGRLFININATGSLYDIDWTNKKIITHQNSLLSLYNLESGKEILSWVAVDSTDWVVTHPSGLFDASAGAMDKLYFVSGRDVVDLNQLKARYYEPGLWKKIMNGEKLRNVVGFNNIELPPDIRVGKVDNKGNLPIEIINRGGGIGEVTLYINGKEEIKDLRSPGTDSKGASLSLSVPVSTSKSLVPGTENLISVKVWNAGQWIESKGTVVKYTPPTKSEIKPAIYVLVCGISDYTGTEIDLKFAAKDAEDMSRALTLGAKRLFGIDKSYVYTLTTNQGQNSFPTKANILKAFDKISSTASSADVIVVYLSGHGIDLGGSEGDFYYLTQDAYTANPSAYNDPAIKKQTTLSSQELVELFKKIPALKQVLIIDACASGKVVDNLMAKRDIESSTLRALDRMKDRTGMHIITGCTADAVSYEASRYGQGILTYSLLEGLRGLALREDKFVDVNQLFQFAQERVPVLASGIGGIQTPQTFSPNGSQSFDFGELTMEDKKQIPIAKARPIYIRSNFIDEQRLRDVLGLGKKMDEMLNEVSIKGEAAPLLFVDVSDYPDACQLSGLYKQVDGKIAFRLDKNCEGKEISYTLEGRDENDLLGKILALINK